MAVSEVGGAGERDIVSEAIPLDWATFFSYLSRYKSLREAAAQMSCDCGRKIAHQSLMDVLSKSEKYQTLVRETEEEFAKNWPRSATSRGYAPYPCIHNTLRRRLEPILMTHRFKDGKWPSEEALTELFLATYSRDMWMRKTDHTELLRAAGIPDKMRDRVFDLMRAHLTKK